MYTIAVSRDFIARHYLIGGDWGTENHPHAHHYKLEVQVSGPVLNQHGYLVDIVDIENTLDAQVAHYRDRLLNELPEFEGLNPSIEHFSRILCHALAKSIQAKNPLSLNVKLWENEIAWASYRQESE